MVLPPYTPPSARQAAVAAGLSPLLVLLNFTLLVNGWMEPDTAIAWLLALSVWVVVELWRYQSAIDRYNDEYVRAHLAWRTQTTLQALADSPALPEPTREFVTSYVAAGGTLLRDGQQP